MLIIYNNYEWYIMKLTKDSASTDLIKFREQNGYTLDKIHEKTGIAKSTLIRIEAGRCKPHSLTIFKLNQFLTNFN